MSGHGQLPPELPVDVLHHIYGYLPELRDLVTCMAVSKEWLGAACTFSKISYDCPSVVDVHEDEKRVLGLLNFARKHAVETAPCLEQLSIKIQGTFSNKALGDVMELAGPKLKQLKFRMRQADSPEECLCPNRNSVWPIPGGYAMGLNPTRRPLGLFSCVSNYCPELEVLEFASNGRAGTILPTERVGNVRIRGPFPKHPSLRSLTLSFVSFEGKDQFMGLLAECPELKFLSLGCIGIPGMAARDSPALPICCPLLEELSISPCPNCSALKNIRVEAPELRKLRTSTRERYSVGLILEFAEVSLDLPAPAMPSCLKTRVMRLVFLP